MGYVPPPEADKRYLVKAGDTMVGPLTLAGDPSQPLHAVTMDFALDSDETILENANNHTDMSTYQAELRANTYTDEQVEGRVLKTGDTMTGQLQIGNSVFLYEDGGTGHVDIGGALMTDTILAANGAFAVDPDGTTTVATPTSPGHSTNKQYVDGRTPKIIASSTAPADLTAIWIDMT